MRLVFIKELKGEQMSREEELKRLAITLQSALVNMKMLHAGGCDARYCPTCRAGHAAAERTRKLIPDWETVEPFALKDKEGQSQKS